jgi:manganese transport system ATP-binding protein
VEEDHGAPDGPAVRLDGVRLAYGRAVALDTSSLVVRRGTSVALIGPNGAGKSTLLDAVAGLRAPVAGRVEVLGGTPRAARRRVAYVVQATEVPRQLPVTVREVVGMGRWGARGAFGPLRGDDRRRVDEAIARLDVTDLARRRLDELSGGQRQRVLVAQGLAHGADLFLLDEPVTGLDLVSREVILAVIRAEVARGATVVSTTHDLLEARTADQVVLLAGRVVASGTPSEVLTAEHLASAYGGRLFALDGDRIVLDDLGHGHAEGHSH